MKKIKSILVEGQGYKYAESQIEHFDDKNQPAGTYRIKVTPIEQVSKNGEMAAVPWYRQGDTEWNGKYVIEINYYPGEQDDISF